MTDIRKNTKKTLKYLIILTLTILGGYLTYAQFSEDAFVVKTVHIFPAEISGDGWSNLETLTFQNLEEYALLQEFNTINSATLLTSDATLLRLDKADREARKNETALPETDDVIEAVSISTPEISDGETTATASSTLEVEDNSNATTTVEFDVVVEEIESTFDTLPQQTSTEQFEVIETENSEPESVDPSATTTVLRQVTSLFRLAVETVTTAIGSSTDGSTDSEPSEEVLPDEELLEEVVTEEPVAVEIIEDDSESVVATSSATTSVEEIEIEEVQDIEEIEVTASTSEEETLDEVVDDSAAGIVESETSSEMTEEIVEFTPASTSAKVGDCEEDCKPYTINLNNFAFPLEEKVEVTGAQLRMSFAAATRENRDRTPLFEARYSVDDGQSWLDAGIIVIDDEVSNSINGGYYLFAMPTVTDQDSLNALEVELKYHDDPFILDELYVESVWLELFTLEPPVETAPAPIAELLANDGFDQEPLSGDRLTLPSGEVLEFEFTDENKDETLIIKSNAKTYQGVSEAATYFSVTNTSDDSDEIQIQAYFPDNVGKVTNLEVFNQNKPREVIIPEYRPYVYHCDAGWEYAGEFEADSLQSLSQQLAIPSFEDSSSEEVGSELPTTITSSSTEIESNNIEPEFTLPTTSASSTILDFDLGETVSNTTTTVLNRLPGVTQLLQQTTIEKVSSTTLVSEAQDEDIEDGILALLDTETAEESLEEGFVAGYTCRNTNVIRECDELDGDNTSCRINQVKVREHRVTNYAPGWDKTAMADDGLPQPGFFKRAAEFIGFGPDRKEVPAEFEARVHTPDTYEIQAGETMYFKMDIAFPPFTNGEYWIEAIGDREYGLLDPFWSSEWTYRLPITIDNTAGASTLTEHQVFLELDSSLTDFWNNVQDDGGDIRFIQETIVGNEEDWYGTGWGSRAPITIQASQVDENLTDFPVYVDLADLGSSFFGSVQSAGEDIRITQSDGFSELPYELVDIDTGGETGELHFNANFISSTTDTTFYIYHDNPNVGGYTASDPFGADNVWGSEYIGVYHLEEEAAGRGNADLYQDSTTNNYDIDDQLNSAGKTGIVGRGQQVAARGTSLEYLLLPSDIVNGENELTFSYWLLSSETGDQALINGGSGNEYLLFVQGGGTTMNLFPGGTVGMTDVSAAPTWRHVTVSRDSNNNLWEVYVDGVSQGTNGTGLSALSIPANCLVIGLEQDGSCLNSTSDVQHLNGNIDELRFRNDIPTDGEVSAQFRNQNNPTGFYTVGTIDTLEITTFSELDHWVQHFSTTTDEADIWVQVDSIAASASTTIYLYYGSTGAVSASDEYAPFTYSSLQDLYYVVHGDVSTDITLYSLIDNNEVSVDGGATTTLNQGEPMTISGYSSTTVISTLGPITSRQVSGEGEPVVPISFATTTHISPSERNTEDFHVYAPFSTATVDIFNGPAVGASSSLTVGVGAVGIGTFDVTADTYVAIVESDEPILLYNEGTNGNDSFVSYPPTTRDLFGFHSDDWFIGTADASTDYDVYCGNGASSTSETITRGERGGDNVCTNVSDAGLTSAVRVTGQTDPVAAIQQADSDGGESTTFLPELEFGTEYFVPTNADYVAAICTPRFGTSTIEIYNSGGTTLTETFTCTPGSETPSSVRFTNGGSGDTLAFNVGTRVVSSNNVPFYLIYDEEGDNESNTWSAVQARKYSQSPLNSAFGAQEVNIDAEYDQLSFVWYQNVNGETPTDTWPLGGGEFVVEGENITGQGSVNTGDVLRLRMNLQANVATGTPSSTAFALQYTAAATCGTATTWQEIGKVGSTTAAFSGFNNSTIDDGQILTSTLLASSTVFGTYEEASLSEFIQTEIPPGEVAEWDWVITSSNAVPNANYCFRMVRSSGDELIGGYSLYPQLITAGPPEAPVLTERFDNEHASSARPTLEFAASDVSGDRLEYQIQIDDDVGFSSTFLDQDSDTNDGQFENIELTSDKTPFISGQTIRYTPPIDLVSSTTYWWRARAIDINGSNTYSEWSVPFSFTINESLTLSEWYQTTDGQFETNSLTGATTTGSGGVELDLGGSNLVGEYDTIEVANLATTTISYDNSYSDPIVVASVRYPRSVAGNEQVSARVVRKGATDFDIRVFGAGNTAFAGSTTIDYIVMESGDFLIDDGANGLRVFATSTLVAAFSEGGNNPAAHDPAITFPTSFGNAPVTKAIVTSNNDPSWIVASVYSGNNVDSAPTASEVQIYLNDNLVNDGGHTSSEQVDLIAFDIGDGVNNGNQFLVKSVPFNTVSDAPYTFTLDSLFGTAPEFAGVMQLTNNGGDGAYAMVDTDNPVTSNTLTVAVDEGGGGGTRGHGAAEGVGIIVFETAGDDILRAGTGLVTSDTIDFDDADVGNAWGEVNWTSSGDVTVRVQYNTGSGFQDVPDSALPNNSTGFTIGPINILQLDTETYNELRLTASLSGTNPVLSDWYVRWGLRVETPSLGDPFDNEKIATTTPTFDFTTTDPQGDALIYEISWSTDNAFETGSTTRISSSSVDFSSGSPYASGATVTFTIPPADILSDGETYWWRVRAKDPDGGNAFSPWSDPDSFTVDTATVVSTWFQTTQEQFSEGETVGAIASSSDSVIVPSSIGVFGTTTLDNSDWQTVTTDIEFDDMVVVAKPSYDFDGTNFRIVRVRNKTNNSFEVRVETESMPFSGSTTVDYIAIERGDWVLEDGSGGVRLIADTAFNVSDEKGSGPGYTNGQFVEFSPAFTGSDPAAILTISSDNSTKWVAASMDHGLGDTASPDNDINTNGMFVGLEISVDSETTRENEDIDYIAFSPGLGTNNGVLFDAFNSGDDVRGTEGPDGVTYNQSFTSAPGVVLAQVNGMDGGQGGTAIQETGVASTNTTGQFMVVEMPADNGHTAEVISIIAFEAESGEIVPKDLGGTIASEPILFSDGTGPKFERALFATTSPGNSSTSVQVQYQAGDGSWVLIPDSQIPNNSTGNTQSPIILTNVDAATYPVIRLFANLNCDGTDCPTLEDWSIEWSEGVPISGTIKEYDRTTDVTSGNVQVAVNGLAGNTGPIALDGTWEIPNVTALNGDVVTVWVTGAATDANKAVSAFVYDGVGDMINIELFEQHLALSADENGTTTNALLAAYDNSVSGNADIFFDVDGNNDLTVCAIAGCSEANLYIGPGDIYIPDTTNSGNVETHDFINDGRFELDGNTMRVSGSFDDNATTDFVGSTVIFTATSTSESIDDTDNLLNFNNVTFGETSGTATWKTFDPLDINGDLVVEYGTFDRSSSTILLAGDLTTGTGGFWSGVSTTTFDGNSTAFWSDNNPSLQDIGNVVIDGGPKLAFLSSDVLASSVRIGANDTLNAGGANTLNLTGDFVNTGTFAPQTSTIAIIGSATDAAVTVGGSSLYNLTASSTGGSVSFTESTVTLLGDLTIATGTVNLATDTTTINGSFQNTGGTFAHNNAEVRFTSGSSETIELQGTEFFNHFYDVRFTGGGDWTFLDTNATTTNTWTQTNGTVVMPSGTLTVGRDFTTSGGDFDANNGEIIFLARSTDSITTNGSALHDVRIREGSPVRGGAYFDEWLYRDVITIDATNIDDDLTDFPVYVDLGDFDPAFFTLINGDGGDIRITTGDGVTEVPREIVAVSTGGETGEVYFKAPTLSSTTNSTFYVYYGNATATDYAIDAALGAENVWDDDFLAVYHMEEVNAVDSTSFDRDGTAVGSLATTGGRVGTAVDITDSGGDDYINLSSNLSELDGGTEVTISTWVNVDEDGGDDVLFATQNGNPILLWDNISGTTNNDTYTFSVGGTGTGNRVDAAPTGISVGGSWQYVTAAMQAGNRYIYVDGVLRNSRSGSQTPIPTNTGGSNIGRWQTSFDYGGLVDEFRISQIERSPEWIAAEYRNMATSTDFYTVTSGAGTQSRIFADSVTTATGDMVIESASAQFPSTNFNIAGSFDNNSSFTAGTGAVTFNGTTTGHTVSASSSSFYDLVFNGPGGSWTIDENATATNNIAFEDADSITVGSGIVLESTGTFTNDVANASTTWTGATLRLSSGSDFTLNSKTNEGDDYNIITVLADANISMWNSSSTVYDTQDTSSIYSQDHDGVDGDLYIFGDYVRDTGVEYWSYETDFDGADLVGGAAERPANIRVVNGGTVTASSSTLEILGATGASTTVDAQSGAFTLISQSATVTAQYFEMTGTDASGFQLLSSSTVTLLDNAEFTIPAVSSAITVDASTIDTNPASQFFNTNFVIGAGTPSNVTLSGSPTSFWWFRDGAGDRYGEAFDNADGNPGNIQWDDSAFQITISGTVYGDDGVNPIGGPTCDGSTTNVRVRVDGTTYTDAVSCDGVTGAYSFSNVAYNGDANILVYLDTNGGSHGTVVTRTPTGDITDLDIYANQVIVRHENIATMAIDNMTRYDNDDDSDIFFTASTSTSPDTLDILAGSGLYVWDNKDFIPNGNVTMLGGGNYAQDGSLTIGPGATYTSTSTNAITVGGSMFVDTSGLFAGASSTVSFTATTTGSQIGASGSSTITFYDIEFTGAGGWEVQTPIVSLTDVLVSNGTVSGISDITVETGEFTGEGVVDMTGGAVNVKRANTLGGSGEWTFYDLILGDGVNSEITVPAANATTTVRNVLTISTGHFLNAYGSVWDLQGSGNPLVTTGTFIQGTSTVRYSGATPAIDQTPYFNLVIDADSGTVDATAPITGLQVLGDLTVGALTTAMLDLNTNDPLLGVSGDVYIGAAGTLEASNSNIINVSGSWDNDGVFTANGGTVEFVQVAGTATIAAGNSDFATVLVEGAADFVFTENATATANFNLDAGGFTLNPGLVLAVGGEFTNAMDEVDTDWTGTTLSLYSGTAYEINGKTTGNTYDTIAVSGTTHPRLWNSTSTAVVTESGSSLYSQDHEGVNGDLYIFGDFVSNSFNDYWSYETDFDGTALGVDRVANVLIEPGGSVLYAGGSLTVTGSSSATTTIAAQSAGTYDFTIGGNTSVDMAYYSFRDFTAAGAVFTGAPAVNDLSNGDYEVAIAGGTAITVGGTVIDANPAKEFNFVRLATTTAINAFNVTATGTSVSAWRFVNVIGNLDGEAKDVDPAPGGGDPGYITWQDSAAIINISGTVYSDEGSNVSAACDSSTGNIYLSINGSTFATTTCNGDGLGGGTGFYQFTGISYGLGNTLTVYIDNEPEKAVAVTQDPVSSISNFDLYENRVIIKHEGVAPMTIADMGTWDSDDDPDVLFDVETTGVDTLTLPADTKLIVWNNKEFEPGGDVIIPGGGSGSAFDGTLELRNGATFTGGNTENYTIGGSLLAGSGATFDSALSTTTFTTTGAGRTIDTNEGGFYNVTFTGSGSWTISDTVFTAGGDYAKSDGALTLPTATSTFAGSFDNTGGTFNANGGVLEFTATDAGNTIEFNGSDANEVRFAGIGDWTFVDTNATATASFVVATGTVALPSGILAINGNFIVTDTIAHSGGTVRLTDTTGGSQLTLSGNDLTDLIVVAGGGDYTQTDVGAALLGDLIIQSGTFTTGTSTLSIGGSFDATGGTFINNSGTVLFNSADTGEIIDPGANDFFNVNFAGLGGWTITDNATATNNFTISTGAASFAQSPGTVLYAGGTFFNYLGGSNTTWTGSTLILDGGIQYEINNPSTPTEQYDSLIIGSDTDISSWNTAATSTVVSVDSSLYSQDNAGVDGDLYIFGDYHIATTTEFWSYATDFNGDPLGVPRAVNVFIADGSTTTVEGAGLNIIGAAGASTTITNQGAGTYNFIVNAGTFNADYYAFRDLSTEGLQLTGTPNITSLNRGDFEQAGNNGSLITLASTTLDANASLEITDTRFDTGGFTAGTNVALDATTTNSWSFTGNAGDLWGESFDIEGGNVFELCSSIRWDDSDCLLIEQVSYRWRNDDGGEGAASGTWYDNNWSTRKRVRLVNNDPSAYTNVAVKLDVAYESGMQSDFDDLRFTDSTGTVLIDHWLEKFTTASDAIVWVEVPTMATSSVTEIYMYYGNVGAGSLSNVDNVFIAADDFEDNDITEYGGNTTLFATGGTYAYGGLYGLDASPNTSGKTASGIATTSAATTVSQGQIIRFMQNINLPSGSGDEVCTLFGVQGLVTNHQNYAVCLSPLRNRVAIVENARNNDTSGTQLATSSITFASGWYEVEIDWQTDNTIDVSVFDESGTLQATTTANDSSYTSGGIGFAFWFQNGGWDSYVSWPRTDTKPRVFFGAEQSDGGASWAAPQDTPTGGYAFGQTARLRVGVENTGLGITDQNFRLEFAPKLTAPTCQAVSGGSYTAVPIAASCGSSEICMATSASTTNSDPTTDHLVLDSSNFISGEIVANTSNQTNNLDVDQNQYTELEYAINLTVNAINDAYCFRVTDGGDTLDSYARIPELTLAFDPVFDTVVLNNGLDISLTPGATTTVIASSTVTDFNGFSDLAYATTTFYKTSVGAACTPNNNNCYVASSTACSFIDCSGASCTLNCSVDFQFHTDPTDEDGGEEWFAFMEVEDFAGGVDLEGSMGVELLTLRALDVQNAIGYGTVDVTENTGAFNPNVTLNNFGNEPIDVEVSGTDMTDGVTSIIPASQQIFATTTFSYDSCVSCNTLSVTGADVEVDLSKPTTDNPPVTDEIYWGIEVPFGTASNPHSGLNTFSAIAD